MAARKTAVARITEDVQAISQPCSAQWLRPRTDWHGRGRALFGVSGNESRNFSRAWVACIASLFFLQGARLSRAALVAGAEHWRLHAAIAFATFVLFSIAWVGVMGGSAARAPAVAVVGSVVCLRSSLHPAILDRLDLDLARQCRGGSLFSGRVQSGWPVSHPDFVRACVWGAQKRDQSSGEPANRLAASYPFCRRPAVASVDWPRSATNRSFQ